MLKRRDRIERLDVAIADAEFCITEQMLLIIKLEANGRDASEARRSLVAFEHILVEYHKAREAMEESERLMGQKVPPAS